MPAWSVLVAVTAGSGLSDESITPRTPISGSTHVYSAPHDPHGKWHIKPGSSSTYQQISRSLVLYLVHTRVSGCEWKTA